MIWKIKLYGSYLKHPYLLTQLMIYQISQDTHSILTYISEKIYTKTKQTKIIIINDPTKKQPTTRLFYLRNVNVKLLNRAVKIMFEFFFISSLLFLEDEKRSHRSSNCSNTSDNGYKNSKQWFAHNVKPPLVNLSALLHPSLYLAYNHKQKQTKKHLGLIINLFIKKVNHFKVILCIFKVLS